MCIRDSYEGYDKEPEDLNAIGQQIKQIETQKKDNIKQTAYLMKEADAAQSNDEANKLNTQACLLYTSRSTLRFSATSTMTLHATGR